MLRSFFFSFIGTQLHQALWDTGGWCGILVQRCHGQDRVTPHKQHPQPAPPAILHQVAMRCGCHAREGLLGNQSSQREAGESTTPQQASPLTGATLHSACSVTLVCFVFSISIAQKRWGSCLVCCECRCIASPCLHISTRQPKDTKLWAREPLRLYIFLWWTAYHKELPIEWVCAPCFSLQRDWMLKATQQWPLLTHCEQTQNMQKWKKRYFFYHLFIKFGLLAMRAACCTPSPILALLYVLFCLFVFFGIVFAEGGVGLGVDAALDSELSYCCCIGFLFS